MPILWNNDFVVRVHVQSNTAKLLYIDSWFVLMLDWTAGLGPVVFRRAGISVWAVAWKADIAGRKGKLQRLQKNSLRVGVAFFGDVHHGSSD